MVGGGQEFGSYEVYGKKAQSCDNNYFGLLSKNGPLFSLRDYTSHGDEGVEEDKLCGLVALNGVGRVEGT